VEMSSPLIRIPVCYDPAFAPDMIRLSAAKKCTPEELIGLHTAATYKVYMLGFLPGFAYMGGTDERIAMPRKPQPVKVMAGSVGIAGRQTGIYPLDSPGGWHIIGRTPLRMFDPAAKKPVLLNTGDRVQFYTISKNEFLFMQEGLTRHKEEEEV
jgi:inhibitor of KinA